MNVEMQKPLSGGTEFLPGIPIPVAGFWRRALALVIDVCVLTFAVKLVVSTAFSFLYPARWFCQFAGFGLSFAYFAACSSRLTGGRTLGQRLLEVRIVGPDGAPPSRAVCLKRSAFIQMIIFPYVTARGNLLFPGPSANLAVLMMAVFAVSAAYTLANAVFCGLDPKKRSFHDLITRTTAVRTGEEETALVFVQSWDDISRAKCKLAVWPAGTIAIIVLLFFGSWGIRLVRWSDEAMEPHRTVAEYLEFEGFNVGHQGPSPTRRRKYLSQLEAIRQTNPDAMPTTETLRYAYTGAEFRFTFDMDELMTSPTLTTDPRFRHIVELLPGLAEDLSWRFYKNDDDSDRFPYNAVQMEFVATLPAYLYTKRQAVYREVLDVEGYAPAVADETTPDDADEEEPTSAQEP